MGYDLMIPSQLLAALTPDLILMGGSMVLMLFAAWRKDSAEHQRAVGYGAMVLLVLTLASVVYMASKGVMAGDGVIAVDSFRWAVDVVILFAAIGTVALSIERNDREGMTQGETHVLVLFAAAGMMILAAARDMMVVFLGIEIMSVATYVLAGLNRRSPRAAEASLKYFLLGAFATGFLLYGIALIYGATGETQFGLIAQKIGAYALLGHPMLLVGIGLLTIGFGFKIAAAPFHMWAPDVYDGASSPITAFFASAVKAAAFAAIARIWYECFQNPLAAWAPVMWWIAAGTMVVGNVVALAQQNLKRMLAYSSIAHTGYLLVAVLANSSTATASLVFYVMAYTLATFGAFAVIAAVQGDSDRAPTLSDIAGLWHERPWLATVMSVFLLSLMGFPVFGGVGFFAKWYLLQAALSSPLNLSLLAVIVVLTSVVSAGYYLQVVRVMFMQPRAAEASPTPVTGTLTRAVLAVAAFLILALGVYPTPMARWARTGAMPPLTFDARDFMGARPGTTP